MAPASGKVDAVGLGDLHQAGFEGDQTFAYVSSLIGGYGTPGNDDWIDGTTLDDELYGLDGDDTLKGREGDDFVDGGLGFDQVVYDAAWDDLLISRQEDGSYLVRDLTFVEGVDRLVGIEALYSEADQRWHLLDGL